MKSLSVPVGGFLTGQIAWHVTTVVAAMVNPFTRMEETGCRLAFLPPAEVQLKERPTLHCTLACPDSVSYPHLNTAWPCPWTGHWTLQCPVQWRIQNISKEGVIRNQEALHHPTCWRPILPPLRGPLKKITFFKKLIVFHPLYF